MSTSALPCPTNFHAYGPGFAATLAPISGLSDTGHAASPQDWHDLTALLHTSIEGAGMPSAMAAGETAVPDSTVAHYRSLVGI